LPKLLIFLLIFCLPAAIQAQQKKPAGRKKGGSVRKIVPVSPKPAKVPEAAKKDSLKVPEVVRVLEDTSAVFTQAEDSSAQALEDEVKYQAEDSVVYEAGTSKVRLYGNATVDYTDLRLTAAFIEVDLSRNTAFAHGVEDSSGRRRGKPVFTQGSDKYEAEAMTYNFRSKRAKIQGVVTQQGEGYIHGESVKKTPENEMYIRDARYTTCNQEHPHFHIQASKIKVIPGKKLVTGPFNLHFMDLPTPLGFGFGIFPTPKSATSGIIVPTYGEAVDRGFFLRNGGYYWHINDYVDARFLGDIYSKGSYGFSVISSYKKRYSFGGNVDIRYSFRKAGDDDLTPVGKDFWLNWTHTPETRGTSSFSASVNLGTSSFNQRNSFSTNNYLSSSFSSNIAYSKTFRGTPFSMGINARQQQNVVTNQVDLELPSFNLNMNRIFPFRGKSGSSKTWYQKIGIAYNLTAQNSISNAPVSGAAVSGVKLVQEVNPLRDSLLPFSQENFRPLLDRMRSGVRHSVPVSTSFSFLKYLQVSPSFNYEEYWYRQRLSYSWIESERAVDVDTIRKFSRAYQYSGSVSMQTRLYGMFFIRRAGIEAIRHVMNPSISFSYRPDFSDPRYGMVQEVQADTTGRKVKLSPFAGAVYGGSPAQGRSGAISFSLVNTIEMKVRNKKDSTGKEAFKKINLLDNLSASGSYNLAADSFQLSPISLSARTTLFDKLNINLNGVLDPYSYQAAVRNEAGQVIRAQRRLPQYAWNSGRGVGQISSLNLAASTSLNPKAREKKNLKRKNLSMQEERELDFINANPELFVDFSIPWNLNVSYNISYSKNGFEKSSIMQSMNFSGDVNLTAKWKLGFSSGYDFVNKTLVYPNINLYRDLHCWEMRFNWVPTGNRGSYSIDINVKASVLQDLKLSRRRSWFDR
jgi:hypothetical protein